MRSIFVLAAAMAVHAVVSPALVDALSVADIHGGRRTQEEPLLCRITTISTKYEMPDGSVNETEEAGCIPIYDNRESDKLLPIHLPPNITQTYAPSIADGSMMMSITCATVGEEEVTMGDDSEITVMDDEAFRQRRLSLMEPAKGRMTLMVVRVTTSDGHGPTKSLAEIRQGMFRDRIGFKAQYKACSYGQLEWVDAGGLEVKLDKPLSAYTRAMQLADDAVAKIVSTMKLRSVQELADKIMFCEPGGVGNWIAVAGVNHWRSNFNDQWCLSLTANMHEIGHNLGLQHSYEDGVAYGDGT